ncbi:MAG: beta-ketoacyl synthase chain length factor [Spirochaetota bacterium]|nr:beta-ketoacyl synthase chain length factor [Spirochaetota bacterium]
MKQEFTYIKDIHFINSNVSSLDTLKEMYSNGVFSRVQLSDTLSPEINGLTDNIKSPLKRRMSQLSLGAFEALQQGGAKNIREEDEIYLFTSFAEIDTSNKIIADLELNNSKLVSPVLFHNSVHNTPLGYYTIINKYQNYCLAVSDGINTGKSFVDLIKFLVKVNPEFVIVGGDEHSSFYELEIKYNYCLFPNFVSYKMVRNENEQKGFFLKLENVTWKDIEKSLPEYDRVIADKESFLALDGKLETELLTEYPIVADSPISIITRLSLPFMLELSGKTAVIGQFGGKYFLFEVII